MPTPPAAQRVPALRCRIPSAGAGARGPQDPSRLGPRPPRPAHAPRDLGAGAGRALGARPGTPRGPRADAAGRGRGGQVEGEGRESQARPQRLTSPAPRHPRTPLPRTPQFPASDPAGRPGAELTLARVESKPRAPGLRTLGPLGPTRWRRSPRGQERDRPSRGRAEGPRGREKREDPGPKALGRSGRGSRAGASRARRFSCVRICPGSACDLPGEPGGITDNVRGTHPAVQRALHAPPRAAPHRRPGSQAF